MIARILDLPLWPLVAAYLLLALFFAVMVRSALRRSIERARGRLDPHLYQVLIASLPRPAGVAFFLFAVGAGLRFFPLPPSIETLTKHVLPFLLGTLAVVVTMRITRRAIDAYGESNPSLKATAGIGKAITWIVGFSLVALLVSDAIGVSLAPAITALGVGSLAVALALQDTLSNFFAGVYLLLDKPIKSGDFVRLEGAGQEGYVETIGWRSTSLRTLAPSRIIVPNATLSKAVITNFRDLNPRLVISTLIEVAIDSDPETTARVLGEESSRIVDTEGVKKSAAPVVRFAPGVSDRGLAFTIYCTIEPGTEAAFVQQELRKRVFARLRREGVKLADPNPLAGGHERNARDQA